MDARKVYGKKGKKRLEVIGQISKGIDAGGRWVKLQHRQREKRKFRYLPSHHRKEGKESSSTTQWPSPQTVGTSLAQGSHKDNNKTPEGFLTAKRTGTHSEFRRREDFRTKRHKKENAGVKGKQLHP